MYFVFVVVSVWFVSSKQADMSSDTDVEYLQAVNNAVVRTEEDVNIFLSFGQLAGPMKVMK